MNFQASIEEMKEFMIANKPSSAPLVELMQQNFLRMLYLDTVKSCKGDLSTQKKVKVSVEPVSSSSQDKQGGYEKRYPNFPDWDLIQKISPYVSQPLYNLSRQQLENYYDLTKNQMHQDYRYAHRNAMTGKKTKKIIKNESIFGTSYKERKHQWLADNQAGLSNEKNTMNQISQQISAPEPSTKNQQSNRRRRRKIHTTIIEQIEYLSGSSSSEEEVNFYRKNGRAKKSVNEVSLHNIVKQLKVIDEAKRS